jgi:hypothetical protein
MHVLVRVLVVSMLANAGLGQPCPNELARCVRINKLVIESNSLPDADRERIVRSFQQKRYPEDVDEFRERIRQALRNVGYFKAVVDEPRFSFPTESRGIANVTVKVEPGAQYRLGEIRFQRATVSRLRSYGRSSRSGTVTSLVQPNSAWAWTICGSSTRHGDTSTWLRIPSQRVMSRAALSIWSWRWMRDNRSTSADCIWREWSLIPERARRSWTRGSRWRAGGTTRLICSVGSWQITSIGR